MFCFLTYHLFKGTQRDQLRNAGYLVWLCCFLHLKKGFTTLFLPFQTQAPPRSTGALGFISEISQNGAQSLQIEQYSLTTYITTDNVQQLRDTY